MNEIQEKIMNRAHGVLGIQRLPRFAVFVPLVEIDGVLNVLFQERAHHLRRQPGEICFPGGRIESSDRDEQAAAVRETNEELGLSTGDVECFGPLDYLIEPHRVIFPFAGQIVHPERIRPNEEEVSRIFYIPLEELKAIKPEIHSVDVLYRPNDGFPFELMLNDRGTMWKRGEHDIYFYSFEDFTVWGLTAVILHHFLESVPQN